MRRVVYYVATSLDGYIAGKGGEIDWLFHDQDYGYGGFIETVDTIVMGRTTFEVTKSFGAWPYASIEAYVFSRTITETGIEKVAVVSEDACDFIGSLKGRPGKKIWFAGGSMLARDFLVCGLIDEFVISIHPVLLGEGIPCFLSGFPGTGLTLKNMRKFESGLVQLEYVLKDAP